MNSSRVMTVQAPIPKQSYPLFNVGCSASPGIDGTLGKIDFFTAPGANMLTTEFIRKYFLFLPAFRALAGKYFQAFELIISGAVLWC